jgi:hypothetical protein
MRKYGTFWRKDGLFHEEKEMIDEIWPLEA